MVEKTVLENGITIISEFISGVPSFALSFTLKTGSGTESKDDNGIHHLIEHMLFKGNENYTQREIAVVTDRLGGNLNAFTSREITQFYVKAVEEKAEESFRLLTSMLFNSRFNEHEFKKEKSVVSQEIRESEDSPDTHIFDLFYKNVFGNKGIGLPITGTINSIKNLSRERVLKFYKEQYVPANIIVSCAGNIKHDRVVSLTSNYLEGKNSSVNIKEKKTVLPVYSRKFFLKKRNDLQQCYSITGMRGVSINNPKRYLFLLFNDILGSGMNSRLFQIIREKKALAYTISSFPDSYSNFGLLLIFSILEVAKMNEYYDTLLKELNKIKNRGLSVKEIEISKDHLKSSLILNLESNVSRMRFNLNNELYYKRERSYTEIIDGINSIDKNKMDEFLNEIINIEKMASVFYGNIDKKKVKAAIE